MTIAHFQAATYLSAGFNITHTLDSGDGLGATGFNTFLAVGAIAPADFNGEGILVMGHSTFATRVELGSILPDTFWDQITFKTTDANWDDFILLRSTRTAFNNSGPFTEWTFGNRDVPFLGGVQYLLEWV